MPDYRGDIRRTIFTKVRDNSIDIMKDAIAITNILSEFSKRYENFIELEKLNIELTVPIQLPPNGQKGDCKSVVLEVQKSFNELGGGSRIYHALGSWLDKEKKVIADHCVVVYTAIPIAKWFECIPVLQRLIRDEIQTKLFQQEVFLRIDNQTFGKSLNLLREKATEFVNIEFGEIDSACIRMFSQYEEPELQTVVNQEIKGEGNIQISSGRDANVAIGEGAIAASGDIHVHKYGIDEKEHAEIIAEKLLLEQKLAQLKEETVEERREQIALEATTLAENMQKEKNIKFDASDLTELGHAANITGQLDLAKGYYKQSLVRAEVDGSRRGEAIAMTNIGTIELTNGNLNEASHLFENSIAIFSGIEDQENEAISMNNLALVKHEQGELHEAIKLYEKCRLIWRKLDNKSGMAGSLHNLGIIEQTQGKFDEAKHFYQQSLAIREEISDRPGAAMTLLNLGVIEFTNGNLVEAERLYGMALDLKREIEDFLGVVSTLRNLGISAKKRGDLDEAERRFREAIETAQNIGSRYDMVRLLRNLADILGLKGNKVDMENILKEANEIARKMVYDEDH